MDVDGTRREGAGAGLNAVAGGAPQAPAQATRGPQPDSSAGGSVDFPELRGSSFIQCCEAADVGNMSPTKVNGTVGSDGGRVEPNGAEYYRMDHARGEALIEQLPEDRIFEMLGITDAGILPLRKTRPANAADVVVEIEGDSDEDGQEVAEWD